MIDICQPIHYRCVEGAHNIFNPVFFPSTISVIIDNYNDGDIFLIKCDKQDEEVFKKFNFKEGIQFVWFNGIINFNDFNEKRVKSFIYDESSTVESGYYRVKNNTTFITYEL